MHVIYSCIHYSQARQIAEMVNAGIQPLQNPPVLGMTVELAKNEKASQTWAFKWVTKGFEGKGAATEATLC